MGWEHYLIVAFAFMAGIVVGLPLWAWIAWIERKDRNLYSDPSGPY